MDDNQCRTCLGEANDSRYSVFKKINGLVLLEFVCGLNITQNDNFSKLLCKKCFNAVCSAYAFKTKSLDTDRTLKILEKKLDEKLEKLTKIAKSENKSVHNLTHEEYIEPLKILEQDFEELEFEEEDEKQGTVVFEEEAEEFQIESYDEEAVESFEVYEEIEFLEPEILEEEIKVEEKKTLRNPTSNSRKLCKFCKPSVAFKTEFALKRHTFEEHQIGDNNPLMCQICGFGFDGDLSEEQLSRIIEKHSNAHDRGKNFSCMFCPEVFKTARSLEEHHFRHLATSTPQNRCKSCQSIFVTSDDLQAHLCSTECKENHEKPFRCYICQENFAMGITKKKHVQEEHADKAGADCPLCLRCKIPSALAYENHFKTHFAEPRFVCSYCARSFFESDRLQTHIKRAHESTKYECNWCSKVFRDKSGITRHILGVHFNRRNHRCKICRKAFTESYNLKEHMFSVHKTASKFYSCDMCCQDFLYRKQFDRHRKNCNGIPEKRKR